ncbi:MAG: hypothetical protein ACLFRT_06515 [Actinomycetota bacterium]
MTSATGYMKSGFGVAARSEEDLLFLGEWLESGVPPEVLEIEDVTVA